MLLLLYMDCHGDGGIVGAERFIERFYSTLHLLSHSVISYSQLSTSVSESLSQDTEDTMVLCQTDLRRHCYSKQHQWYITASGSVLTWRIYLPFSFPFK